LNAFAKIIHILTEVGMVILVSALQFEKVFSRINPTEVGMRTVVRNEENSNADCQMTLTDVGMLMLTR